MIARGLAINGRSLRSMPIPSWCRFIGSESATFLTAVAFMNDLAGRLANRVQLSSDALVAYVEVTERAFGADIDYGQAA